MAEAARAPAMMDLSETAETADSTGINVGEEETGMDMQPPTARKA